MKVQLTLAALAVTLLVAGWLAGGAGNVAEAQEQVVTEEWKMFSNNVAGTGGSGGGANEFASGGGRQPRYRHDLALQHEDRQGLSRVVRVRGGP